MQNWQWISLALCAFGFFKEFRPSEPFVTEYLMEHKNFTKETIVQVAYPIGTYTYFGTLPIVFLITDFLRYKTVIVVEALAFMACYTLLLWGNGLTSLRILQVFYGIASSTEVAYYTYIYSKVSKDNYKKVTSYTYTALLLGNLVAAVVAQTFVSLKWMDYRGLTYLTLGGATVAFVIACFLPGVKRSIYFHNPLKELDGDTGSSETLVVTLGFGQRVAQAYRKLWADFKLAYGNKYVLKWSVWWILASACFSQVVGYIQALYEEIHPTEGGEDIYNAGVDAVHSLISAALSLGIGYAPVPWARWGEPFLTLMSLIQCAMLIVISQTRHIFVAYGCYIVFRTSYQVMITVASAEVAQGISQDSSALIFGINRFLALSIQTIITLIVVDQKGLTLGERDQFLLYGIYFGVLGLLFGIVVVISAVVLFTGKTRSNNDDAKLNYGSTSTTTAASSEEVVSTTRVE